jgi:hypothetical protein
MFRGSLVQAFAHMAERYCFKSTVTRLTMMGRLRLFRLKLVLTLFGSFLLSTIVRACGRGRLRSHTAWLCGLLSGLHLKYIYSKTCALCEAKEEKARNCIV